VVLQEKEEDSGINVRMLQFHTGKQLIKL